MSTRLPLIARPGRWWRSLRRSAQPGLRRALWFLLFGVILSATFASVALPREVNLHAGQVAPYTITARRDFVDRPATAAAQAAAAARVQPVYSIDPTVAAQSVMQFDSEMHVAELWRGRLSGKSAARQAAGGGGAPAAHAGTAGSPAVAAATPAGTTGAAAKGAAASKSGSPSLGTAASSAAASHKPAASVTVAQAAAALRSLMGVNVPNADYTDLLSLPAARFDVLAEAGRGALQSVLNGGVRTGQSGPARGDVLARVLHSGSRPASQLVAALAARALTANDFLNGPATDAAVAAARAAVPPTLIAAGQVIVRQGDRVTPADIVLLRDAGLLHPGGPAGVIGASVLIAAALCALCWAYVQRMPRSTRAGDAPRVLFAALFCASVVAVRLGAPISAYLAPVTFGAILTAVAFDSGAALFVGALAAFAAGLLDSNLAVAVTAAVAAWAAVFGLGRTQQRSDLLLAGVYAAAAGAAGVLLVVLFVGQNPESVGALMGSAGGTPWINVAAAAFSGLLSGALAVGTLPLLEYMGVLTPFHLLELGNPSQPLLRRLMSEAPGTYHHSLMVANLAEAACQAVGADALLARTGAYYHDIGKIRRPYFFVENQLGGENPHDRLSPHLSALIIISHVSDGVDLGRSSRLPEGLVDFIRSHHGTTLVGYFHHLARVQAEEAGGAGGAAPAPDEAQFRYEGPRPASRETAIVMLADCVEAAVRACKQPTAEQIHSIVDELVAARLQDGQLDAAALTLRDLDLAKAAFRRVLAGAYHARIEYPAQVGGRPVSPRPPAAQRRAPLVVDGPAGPGRAASPDAMG